ncbi:GDP/UDP-N,N'-diacetylbacillosamine 2-epimerase (hydrolyzing) [Peptococcaceae bacterium CEB3]|nr:GDP/UDP-N,N'-diacetylbacillosamine 2-epimerase (hydrolyzing) [Peptococcaceae bacterium CEB3]
MLPTGAMYYDEEKYRQGAEKGTVNDRVRKICVVTGSRAEYGLLYPLLREIQADPDLELLLLVTGTHLSPEFGLTYREIERDGFTIADKVEMLLSADTPTAIAKSVGLATIGLAESYARLQPDIVVILGDRYEILAAAQAALFARIPLAHLHGGERTEGAMDEAIRHAVTKMAHLHFVAAEPYRRRVIQLGEDPARVFNVGAVGSDNIRRQRLRSRESLERELEFPLGKVNFLVTYHPVTLGRTDSASAMGELLAALDHFPEAQIIFTKPNSDTDGRVIGRMMESYAARQPERAKVFVSLGQVRYFSAVSQCAVVIGNSSSGLTEVPALGRPAVNLGERQKGRLRPASVIDCAEREEDIVRAITEALSPEFQARAREIAREGAQEVTRERVQEMTQGITGGATRDITQDSTRDIRREGEEGPVDPDVGPEKQRPVARRIKEILKEVNIEGLRMKSFFDLPAPKGKEGQKNV